MLELYPVSKESEKLNIFMSQFQTQNDLWVVGDLKSKIYLQELLLKKEGYLAGEPILRIQEFWIKLFESCKSTYRIVSLDYLQLWLEAYLIRDSGEDSLFRQQSTNFFLELIQLLHPVYINSQGEEVLLKFFDQYPDAKFRWSDWSELCYTLFQLIYLNHKWLLPEWLPSHLLHNKNELDSILLDKRIWFDLAGSLKQSESALIEYLSKNQRVSIFQPEYFNVSSEFSFLMSPYLEFSKYKKIKREGATGSKKAESFSFIEAYLFSTELRELKFIVAKTRKLIETKNMSPSEIIWIFPEVSRLAPLLQEISSAEGLPIEINETIKLSSKPMVQKWLRTLRLLSGKINFYDLELSENLKKMPVSQRQAYFKNITTPLELSENYQSTQVSKTTRFELDEFVKLTYSYWPEDQSDEDLVTLFNRLYRISEVHVKFSFEDWLSLVEKILPYLEIPQEKETFESSVRVLNLSEWGYSEHKVAFVGGVSDQSIKKKEFNLIKNYEFDRLGWDFGYFLDHPGQNLKELDLSWIFQNPFECIYLTASYFDIFGSPQSPHLSLLDKKATNYDQEVITYWDFINQQTARGELAPKAILRDSDLNEYGLIKPHFPLFMGVTTFESFAKCPFQFSLTKKYLLKDPVTKDIDMDLREEGTFFHKIMELVVLNWDQIKKNQIAKKDILDLTFKDMKLDEKDIYYKIKLNEADQFYDQFLDYESNFRKDHPHIRVIGTELELQLYLNLKDQEITLTQPDLDSSLWLCLKGKIDRVEEDQETSSFYIVDYKRSYKEKYNKKNWIDSNFFQIGLYGLALQESFRQNQIDKKWMGAQIFSYSKMERRGGMSRGDQLPYKDWKISKNDYIYEEDWESFIKEFKIKIFNVAEQITKGLYRPEVKKEDQDLCNYCFGRNLCRAPHLLK